jgi:curli biogenesis system outer membrane secretion channel CsgG
MQQKTQKGKIMDTRKAPWKLFGGLVIALLLLASPSHAGSPGGGLRYSVVVDKFENKTDNHRLGDEWATLLTSALHENGHFIVVAQDDMQLKALKEQLRGLSGVTAQGKKTAARGRMTPAQLLVKGVLTAFEQGEDNQGGGFGIGPLRINAGRTKTEVRGTIQMIDATTGAVVAAKNFTGAAQSGAFSLGHHDGNKEGNIKMGKGDHVQEALEKAITQVISWMAGQLSSVPWRGSVLKVDGQSIIVNRGSREGIASGDELIAGESEILSDPDTGETLDEVVHERARLRVTQVSERTATCSVVSGDAGQIVEGMGIKYSSGKS